MTVYYTEEHEWIRRRGRLGARSASPISRRASSATSSSSSCPRPGRQVTKGGEAAVVESVKAASDVYAPVERRGDRGQSGARPTIPSLVNSDPEGEGWFFRLRLSDPSELDGLMDADAYKAFADSQ